ncbi:MAG: 2-C-methyl-D-erythritol 4-phosphate cytidylyltransferase [Thermoleophilaceae bacterium]
MGTVVAIVPAGGSGERLGSGRPKAFVPVAGRALLDWSVEVLASACDRVVVAVPAGEEAPPDRVRGGDSRSASVRSALEAAPEAEVAVVHDAARPLLTRELVERCLAALAGGPFDGVIAAARVTDTIKQADGAGRVLRTLERSALWAVQTPQVFHAAALRRALAVDGATLAAATDDASLLEAAGGTVGVVESSPENLKVTTPLDLRVAEALLRARTPARPVQ